MDEVSLTAGERRAVKNAFASETAPDGSRVRPGGGEPLGSEKWSVGPAVSALKISGELFLGAIVLANFSVAGKSDRDDVSVMTVQPLGSYGVGNGWSIEASEMMYNYDFKTDKWATVPLGGRIGKLTTFGDLPVRFYADAEYNFADSGVAPKWTLRFAAVPLF